MQSPVSVLASAGGQALRLVTGIVSTLRPAAKPLHPKVRSRAAPCVDSAPKRRLAPRGLTIRVWIGSSSVSREPSASRRDCPHIFGLALRVPTPGGAHGDLLLASTGLGRLTRFTLTVSRSPRRRPLTTLLPYRTPSGPVLIAAMHRDEHTIVLSWAWEAAAGIGSRSFRSTAKGPSSVTPRFPSTLFYTLPGLENYGLVRRLREPSYSTARLSRRAL